MLYFLLLFENSINYIIKFTSVTYDQKIYGSPTRSRKSSQTLRQT